MPYTAGYRTQPGTPGITQGAQVTVQGAQGTVQGAECTVPGDAQAITPGTVAQGQMTPGTVQAPAANERVANNQQELPGALRAAPTQATGRCDSIR